MSTTTVYSEAGEGAVQGISTTYTTARSTASSVRGAGGASNECGQLWYLGGDYYVFEFFTGFDTSAIPDGDIVVGAILSLCTSGSAGGTTPTYEARYKDWGGSITTADWVAGASLAGTTPLAATFNGADQTGAYDNFADVAMPAAISKVSYTRFIITTDLNRLGTAPSVAGEFRTWYQAPEAGTTKDPKLVVTHGNAPTVTTAAVSVSTASTATGGGTLTGDGGLAITQYGICWNTTGTPTVADPKTTNL